MTERLRSALSSYCASSPALVFEDTYTDEESDETEFFDEDTNATEYTDEEDEEIEDTDEEIEQIEQIEEIEDTTQENDEVSHGSVGLPNPDMSRLLRLREQFGRLMADIIVQQMGTVLSQYTASRFVPLLPMPVTGNKDDNVVIEDDENIEDNEEVSEKNNTSNTIPILNPLLNTTSASLLTSDMSGAYDHVDGETLLRRFTERDMLDWSVPWPHSYLKTHRAANPPSKSTVASVVWAT